MSDQNQTRSFKFRLLTLYGQVWDFEAPNALVGMWAIIKSDGFFQMTGPDGEPVRRIPYHAIGSLEYLDPTTARIYAPSPSLAKN